MPSIVNNYTNEQLASAAYKDTGTASDEVPLNSDLGTASAANVQTSPTDTTAGALMAVGAFGLGTDGNSILDCDSELVTSFGFTSTVTTNMPSGLAGARLNGTLSTVARGAAEATQLFINTSTETWVRGRASGVWSAWKRTDPQAFGLGVDGTGPTLTGQLGGMTTSGVYSVDTDTSTDEPDITGRYIILRVEVRNVGSPVFDVIQHVHDEAGAIFYRYRDNSTWSAWKRTDPQAFGLGVAITRVATDLNDQTTEFQYYTGSAPNLPVAGLSTAVWCINSDSAPAQQIAMESQGGMWTRYRGSGSVWQSWEPVYTGANYQPDVPLSGLNVPREMYNNSGATINTGDTMGGSSLRAFVRNSSDVIALGASAAGTWLCIQGNNVPSQYTALFVRIA